MTSNTARVGVDVPGDILVPLVALRMSGLEWRVVVTLLLSPQPLSARRIAVHLRRPYGAVKRVARALVAWRILDRTPEGLRIQSDHRCWGPPRPQPVAPSHSELTAETLQS